MSELLKMDAVRNSLLPLVLAVCAVTFAPVAHGQSQAGAATSASGASPAQTQSSAAAKPAAGAATQPAAAADAQNSAQTSAPKATDGGAQAEPQMQDQSAPAAESLGEAARRAR